MSPDYTVKTKQPRGRKAPGRRPRVPGDRKREGEIRRPFNDIPLRFCGFTPVVEVEPTGSDLRRLPEQTLVLPGEITRRGTLVLGVPGSGKTTRLVERAVTSALADPTASVVVFAVQPGSARHALAAFRHHRGTERGQVAHFNAGDASVCTHFINPIAGVESRSVAMDIAQTLVQSLRVTHGDSEYFVQQASTMIGYAIMAVNRLHPGAGTLGMVREAIDGGASVLRTLGERGETPALVRFAEEIINGNRNSETTLAQMSNCLQWLFDENAQQATSRDELDFRALLLDQPGLLVLSVNEEQVPKQRALTSLIFRNLFAWIIRQGREHGGALPRPLFIVIDELPAAGRIPEFGQRLTATFRKSNVSVLAAAQCEAQLHEVYAEETAAVLAGFGSRIYVPPVDFPDAERASARSGFIEVTHHVTTADGQPLSSAPLSRPLLLPGEIASPPRDPELGPRILFRLADLPPFFGYLRASWEVAEEQIINDAAASQPLPRRRPSPGAERPPSWTLPDRRISDTRGWTKGEVARRYREVLTLIGHDEAGKRAAGWWKSFEEENSRKRPLVLRVAEELAVRNATIEEFFVSCLYAGTSNIQANLHYLDYSRLKSQAPHRPEGASAAADRLQVSEEDFEDRGWDGGADAREAGADGCDADGMDPDHGANDNAAPDDDDRLPF